MFSKKVILIHTILSLFISQLTFWLIFLNFEQLPPIIPFWFLASWGNQQLAARTLIWTLPGLAAAILGINLIVITFIHRKKQFLSDFLISTTTITNLFLLAATFNILTRVLGWI